MILLPWILAIALVCGAALWLRRLHNTRSLRRQLATVQIATELWRQSRVLPQGILSSPIRDALSMVFTNSAARLADGPFARLAETLTSQALEIRVSSRPAGTPVAASVPANLGRMLESLKTLLARASGAGLVQPREYALASSALTLAVELANVDILVVEARRALVLRERSRSDQLKAQVLAMCARLPAKTAEEVRKRVQAHLAA